MRRRGRWRVDAGERRVGRRAEGGEEGDGPGRVGGPRNRTRRRCWVGRAACSWKDALDGGERSGGGRGGVGRTRRTVVVGGKSGRGQREFGEALNNGIHAQTQICGGASTGVSLAPHFLS